MQLYCCRKLCSQDQVEIARIMMISALQPHNRRRMTKREKSSVTNDKSYHIESRIMCPTLAIETSLHEAHIHLQYQLWSSILKTSNILPDFISSFTSNSHIWEIFSEILVISLHREFRLQRKYHKCKVNIWMNWVKVSCSFYNSHPARSNMLKHTGGNS